MTIDTIEVEREIDGRWLAEVSWARGAMAYGATREEAVRNALMLAEAIAALEGKP